jgi:hypothetical protein
LDWNQTCDYKSHSRFAVVRFCNHASISKPEPAILCGGLLRLWETPVNFARKSVHLDPVLRSTFINWHYYRQTWIMPLFKLITTLILKRTLGMVLNCCKILVVIYFNLFNYGKSWICCVILNITGNGLSWPYMVILHSCYSTVLLLAYKYQNSLLISYEKRRKLNKFIKVMLCVSLICLNTILKQK